MPYSTSNKQIQDSAFKLKSGNTSPFKQMGASPLKQVDPLDLGLLDEAKKVKVSKMPKNFNMTGKDKWVEQSKKLLKSKTPKVIHQDVITKEITRIGKGGMPKAKQMLANTAKKTASKSWWKRLGGKLGGKAVATLGMYFGSMDTAKATQPGTGKHGGTKIGTYNPETGKYQ